MVPLSHAHDEGADAMSTIEMETPAIGVEWFRLTRHDDPEPAPEGDPDPDPESGDDEEAARLLAEAAAGGDPDPEGEEPDPEETDEPPKDGLGEAGKKALDRMKAERAAAKKEAAAAKKQAAELAKKVEEYEDRDRSELEKAQAKAERSAEQAAKAVARSVRSEIRVAASDSFADVSDATDALMRDPSKYVDSDGEIDTDAIEADLADLLERKPHWAKPEPKPDPEPAPAAKPKPKPDPGQGSRGAPAKVDFRSASDDEVAAELAKYGVRKRY